MHSMLLIALQVAALTPIRPDFKPDDEPALTTRSPLARGSACVRSGPSDEIVVCGRRDPDKFRAKPLPPDYQEGPLRAETSLGGNVKGSVDVEQADVGGFPSNRAKVTIKVPF